MFVCIGCLHTVIVRGVGNDWARVGSRIHISVKSIHLSHSAVVVGGYRGLLINIW
jgi:hypothetical protein